MAAGTRTVYALDLDDIIPFPDSAHTPILPPKPGESWMTLTEIIANESLGRPVFRVRDKLGTVFVAAFYTPNPAVDARDCKVGTMLAVKNARPHRFLDGQVGFRIEDPSYIEKIPCTMNELWAFNQELRTRSDQGLLLTCSVCGSPGTKRCGECKTKYCSRDCQKQDWATHKTRCKVYKLLHRWNRTDWG